jgi:uncharacterized protein (TIGR02246 family)
MSRCPDTPLAGLLAPRKPGGRTLRRSGALVMEHTLTDSIDEAAVRAIIDARNRAVHKGDADGIVADVADDAVSFDVVGELSSQGRAATRARAVQWLGSYDGPVGWETDQVHLAVDGDVGFSHFLSHVSGTLKTGTAVDMWFRTTLGFRRSGGRWRIVHEHSSNPFDAKTGKALTGLSPKLGG